MWELPYLPPSSVRREMLRILAWGKFDLSCNASFIFKGKRELSQMELFFLFPRTFVVLLDLHVQANNNQTTTLSTKNNHTTYNTTPRHTHMIDYRQRALLL